MCRAWLLLLACVAASCANTPSAPTLPANRPPIVTVAFQGPSTCAPLAPYAEPAHAQTPLPCTLPVIAQATDADGDTVTYKWSGCADGTSMKAVCTVSQPGPVTASVEVSDAHGHTTTASAQGEGINHPPVIELFWSPIPGFQLYATGHMSDPEEGDLLCGGSMYCARYIQSVTVSGDCGDRFGHYYYFVCSCREGLEFNLYPNASSGTCTTAISVKDWWGAVGTYTWTVTYPTGFVASRLAFPFQVGWLRPLPVRSSHQGLRIKRSEESPQ